MLSPHIEAGILSIPSLGKALGSCLRLLHLEPKRKVVGNITTALSRRAPHQAKYDDLLRSYQANPRILENPRKAYKTLLRHRMRKFGESLEVAAARIYPDYCGILYQHRSNDPNSSSLHPVAIKILSDWSAARIISRAIDYVALRGDWSGLQKVEFLESVFSRIPRIEAFEGDLEFVSVDPNDRIRQQGEPLTDEQRQRISREGAFFRGFPYELFISPFGEVYQNLVWDGGARSVSIWLRPDGLPHPESAEVRTARRRLDSFEGFPISDIRISTEALPQ